MHVLFQDKRQEEIIKFLEESFSEDFSTRDPNCDIDEGEEGSSSGELEPNRKVKTGITSTGKLRMNLN